MVEQVVELVPGESKLVSFEAVPSVAKTYQVSVDGLSGSFSAIAPPPPVIAGELLRISTTPTSTRVYVHVGPGWNYLLDTVTVRWTNTGNTPIYGRIRATLHPYNYGATGFCSDQRLTAIAGQGALVGPGGGGNVTFSIPHAWGGVLSAQLYRNGTLLDATEPWDPEIQGGFYMPQHYAPGGAVAPEDRFQCL